MAVANPPSISRPLLPARLYSLASPRFASRELYGTATGVSRTFRQLVECRSRPLVAAIYKTAQLVRFFTYGLYAIYIVLVRVLVPGYAHVP